MIDLTSHACSATSEHDVTVSRDAGVDPVPWVGQEAVPSGTPATFVNVPEMTLPGAMASTSTERVSTPAPRSTST